MRLIVGYDREWAVCCFRRNLRQLIRPGENRLTRISNAEVDYVSERLAETAIYGYDNRFGTPWVTQDDARELLKLPVRRATRAQIQRCELIANNLLILEGIIARTGAKMAMLPAEGEVARKRIAAATVLYHKASHGRFRTALEVVVLQNMSMHVSEWLEYLSYFQGNDFMDLLSMKLD